MKNLQVYLERMTKVLPDKIFFTQDAGFKDVDIFFDFGCADGALVDALSEMYPDKVYVGYDISADMEHVYRERMKEKEGNFHIHFVNKLSDVIHLITEAHKYDRVVAVNFSSVLHEIYTYDKKAKETWTKLVAAHPDYIYIRDMSLDIVDPDGVEDMLLRLQAGPNFKDYYEHRKQPDGDLHVGDAIEYLLKYDYFENWERERDERYFYPRDFFQVDDVYEITLEDRFYIPYLRDKIMRDFEIDIAGLHTHYKKIYKLRG